MTLYQKLSLAPCNNDTLRQILDARLNYAHHLNGVDPQSLMRLDESAYQALFKIVQGNPGYLLYTFRRVLSSDEVRQSSVRPYVITADHIIAVSGSLESYQAWQDSPIRDAVVLNVERAGLRSTNLEEQLVREFSGSTE